MNEIDLTSWLVYSSPNRGKWQTLKPKMVELDHQLKRATVEFATLSTFDLESLRRSIPSDTQWTLMGFASRASVFALREKSADWLRASLRAFAMISGGDQDPRDILGSLGRLHYVVDRLDLDAEQEFSQAADLADAKMAEFMMGIVRRRNSQPLQKTWMFTEVKTDAGIGLIRSSSERYEPEADLLEVAMRIAEKIEQDEYYCSTDLEFATKHRTEWPSEKENADAGRAAEHTTGCVTVRARMARTKHSDAKRQMFTIFVLEMETEDYAKRLFDAANTKSMGVFNTIAIRRNKLLAIVKSRSFVKGVNSVETADSLERFREVIFEELQ